VINFPDLLEWTWWENTSWIIASSRHRIEMESCKKKIERKLEKLEKKIQKFKNNLAGQKS
jgi:hypothetical protein